MSAGSVIASALGVAAILFATGAQAVPRTEHQTGSGACDAASAGGLFASIRERTTGIANAGTASAFVTCSLPGFGMGANHLQASARSVSIYFTSEAAATTQVSCTASEGSWDPAPTQATRSVVVPPGSVFQQVRFQDFEVNPVGRYWRTPVISCALPAGVGIANLWYSFDI